MKTFLMFCVRVCLMPALWKIPTEFFFMNYFKLFYRILLARTNDQIFHICLSEEHVEIVSQAQSVNNCGRAPSWSLCNEIQQQRISTQTNETFLPCQFVK